ncbi:MAG: BTAD domain-containing putative transcriptional regulator [Coriobacteriia bacterium]|nr:BTAD domain-containing putative transcriptional regulator [Coriobacteriia bacterium]
MPEFSGMIARSRLVELFKAQSPPLTLICAAAGYGKTVLASQIARESDFDVVAWVQLPDIDVSADILLRQIADVFGPRSEQSDGLIAESLQSPESVLVDDSMRILDGLRGNRGRRVLLVIDGADSLRAIEALTALAADFGRCISPGSRIVVACRRVEREGSIDPGGVWLIEEDDLAFTMDEVQALVTGMTSVCPEDDALRLFEGYLGHPAITRIMIRHGVTTSETQPQDLIWQTERIVSWLDEGEIAALYLAAVLGGGEFAVLRKCAFACDLKLDWVALSRSVPLFHIFEAALGVRLFRVHAVLCHVMDRFAQTKVTEDDCINIRTVVFEQLSRDGEYVRLAAALDLYGSADEVAAWCESDGVSMIRHAGNLAITRLLSRVSPLSIASSARLLVLRAHVQRAAGTPTAALESAVMAKRVAEVANEDASLVSATLLIARLQFDQGVVSETQEMLGELSSTTVHSVSVEAACVREAYLAVAEASLGRICDATRRVESLKHILKGVDQGSDEAAFVVNCISCIHGQFRGDWAAASPLLASLAFRSDMSHYQSEHIRVNYSAVLVETGRTDEAQHLIQPIVDCFSPTEIRSAYAAALGTLADSLWLCADSSTARAVNDRVVKACQDSNDQFGLAAHSINSARALRALGAHEDSLSCALKAESFLASCGASAHMLRLMASIETSASHLALGDVALASDAIENVLADPTIAEAIGHRLRCDLVRAEIDCIRGEWRAAVERLAGYCKYIASGSANMTLACYIRAFSRLLGVLNEALGEMRIPARVLKLIPDNIISDTLAWVEESMGVESASLMRRRYGFREQGTSVVLRQGPSVLFESPILRVHAFGKLEIESSYGCVEYKYWHKRKSRLLFLMLLCAPAHEIPRDVVLERLWPEMEHGNALRNFYVTWSHLRKALMCETKGADVSRFADSNSDACWLTDLLESDIDRFNAELSVMHSARFSGDELAAVSSALRLSDIYRGELLAMNIYDEWFDEDRTRTKRDFCDAMVAGAQAAVGVNKHDLALVFLNRVSIIDPWREDVYQLMMRCQMSEGKRSGAIETYKICRTRLVDDLGIDPCAETVRIFQAVLAMEDMGSLAVPPASIGC